MLLVHQQWMQVAGATNALFHRAPKELYNVLDELNRCICSTYIDQSGRTAFVYCSQIDPLNKDLGKCSIGICETECHTIISNHQNQHSIMQLDLTSYVQKSLLDVKQLYVPCVLSSSLKIRKQCHLLMPKNVFNSLNCVTSLLNIQVLSLSITHLLANMY